MPANMSFPFAAIPPERGVMKPILIGPLAWAHEVEGLNAIKLTIVIAKKTQTETFFITSSFPFDAYCQKFF
jgi:hypothetical protein